MTRAEYDKLKKLIENWRGYGKDRHLYDEFHNGVEQGMDSAADDLLHFLNVECDGVED